MLSVRISPATSAALINPENVRNRFDSSLTPGGISSRRWNALKIQAAAAKGSSTKDMESGALTGVVFEPCAQVQQELAKVPASCSISLARQRFHPACEAALNAQINVEYNASYVYHALFAYFDRDNVGLPGLAKFFKEQSEEEREHAEKFMKYQNLRGGKVLLHSILGPSLTEFDHADKGDALHAMETALVLEKITNEKLLELHKVAADNDDVQMQDYIESEFLKEQVESIKKIATYVSQLRRVGKGHGVYHFDRTLEDED